MNMAKNSMFYNLISFIKKQDRKSKPHFYNNFNHNKSIVLNFSFYNKYFVLLFDCFMTR